MNPTLTALVLHDLKNALGSLEEQLSRLSVLPNAEDAGAAHHQCQELRLRFVQWLTVEASELNDGQGLPVWCEDESPEDLLQAAAERAGQGSGGQTCGFVRCVQGGHGVAVIALHLGHAVVGGHQGFKPRQVQPNPFHHR